MDSRVRHIAKSITSVKMVIYYFHERVWFKVSTKLNTKMRHVAKAFTWRVIASATTFGLALLLFSGHDNAMEKATYIALIESVLKMIFYYGHEEAWYRINLGLDNREKNNAAL